MKTIKVIAIWTQTIDGYIAKSHDDDLSWGARVDKQWFSKVTREMGVIVMGRKTFELIGRPLPGRLNIIMTRNKNNLEFTNKNPRQILRDLQKRGFKQVAICGGASIYTLWLKEKLVDEVWVSVQPVIFGQGIIPTSGVGMELELMESEEIGEGVIVLKYKVVR